MWPMSSPRVTFTHLLHVCSCMCPKTRCCIIMYMDIQCAQAMTASWLAVGLTSLSSAIHKNKLTPSLRRSSVTHAMCFLSFFSALMSFVKHFMPLVKVRRDSHSCSPLTHFHFLQEKATNGPWFLLRRLHEEQSGVFLSLRASDRGSGSFLLVVSDISALLVRAQSRACLVSLPSSIPFPGFLCMLRARYGFSYTWVHSL